MPQSKSTIGVFFGSRSPEHDVSIITATRVIRGLRNIGFSVVPVYIAKDGSFYLGPDTDDPADETLARVSYFKDNLAGKLNDRPEYQLLTQNLASGLRFQSEGVITTQTTSIDIVFPAFHGPHGEDGSLYGLFELADIPYVGCSRASCSVAMDKALTKLLYQQFDIPTTEFIYFTDREWNQFADKILEDLKYFDRPLFVKPARAGSSIGIARVEEDDDLSGAIDTAFNYDSKVVVEEGVANVADLTIALVGTDNPEASLIQESQFADDFFSYKDKYIEGGGAQIGGADKQVIIPAEIEDNERKEVRQLAQQIFANFELSGIARVDFLLDRDDRTLYANEINTMPGTLYRHLWEESGKPFSELLRELIRFAKQEHQRRQELSFAFDSPILDHAGGDKLGNKLADENEGEAADN